MTQFAPEIVPLSDAVNGKRSKIIEALAGLPKGKAIKLRINGNLRSLRMSLSMRARRAGLRLATRRIGDWLYLFHPTKEQKQQVRRNPERDGRIMEALQAGQVMQEVANQFSISRQRVEQIARFSTLPVQDRTAAVDAAAAPYLSAVTPNICVRCGQELDYAHLCKSCKESIGVIRDTKSRLRVFQKTGDRHYLAMANVLIRKYALKPEDLRQA